MKSLRMAAFAAAAALIGTGAAVAGLSTTAGAAPAGTVLCDQYASTASPNGAYIIQNNRWGTSAQQCITVTANGFTLSTSNANVPTNGAPASYPSIYWGCHYGNCTPGFNPIQASSSAFSGISTSVGMSFPSSGQWDAAYDIWFDPTARRDGQNTGAEVMVWANHLGAPQPVGSKVATVSLAGGTWDVWFGNIGWNVISYVRTAGTGSLSFPVSTFFNDAVTRGYAQRSWYLTSIQAGFEPWTNGTGLAVTNFSVTTSGGGPTGSPTGSPTSSPTSTPPNPAGGCSASVRVASQWNGGYTADVTVANNSGSTTRSWSVSFTGTVTNGWNATFSANGSLATARNLSYNGTLAPNGGSTTFGFQGSGTPPTSATCTSAA
jgi:hypothetical protein